MYTVYNIIQTLGKHSTDKFFVASCNLLMLFPIHTRTANIHIIAILLILSLVESCMHSFLSHMGKTKRQKKSGKIVGSGTMLALLPFCICIGCW